jgi:hypothetical protein
MLSKLLLFVSLIGIAGCGTEPESQPQVADEIWPLAIGNQWIYDEYNNHDRYAEDVHGEQR